MSIDLGGFTIRGNGTKTGIVITGAFVSVRNGIIRNFEYGIDGTLGTSLDHVTVIGNSGYGAVVGSFAAVRDCSFFGNGPGLVAGNHALVTGNMVVNSSANGIEVNNGSIVSSNIVAGNASDGIFAVSV